MTTEIDFDEYVQPSIEIDSLASLRSPAEFKRLTQWVVKTIAENSQGGRYWCKELVLRFKEPLEEDPDKLHDEVNEIFDEINDAQFWWKIKMTCTGHEDGERDEIGIRFTIWESTVEEYEKENGPINWGVPQEGDENF